MTSRWFRGAEADRQRGERDHFDPVAEGDRYRLAPEVSLEIWKYVCAEATNPYGLRDEERARRRFHQVAERAAANGGRLRPDPCKVSQIEAETWGRDPRGDVFSDIAPGKVTRVEVEAWRWARRMRRAPVPGAAAELPHAGEVAALLAAMSPETRDAGAPWSFAGALGFEDTAGAAAPAPPVPASAPVEVPRRAAMESIFGATFADIAAHVGEAATLAPHGARGAAWAGTVMFASADPDLDVVAHELAHVQQLRQVGDVDATPRRPWSVGWDAAEVEADQVAHAVARGATSARVAARPAASVSFDTSPAGPGPDALFVPPGLEASFEAELARAIGGDDMRGARARRRRLVALCRTIASPYRERLAERLEHPRAGDGLVARIRGEFHPATVAALVAALRGLPDVAPAGEATATLVDAALVVTPATEIVIDRDFAATSIVQVTPRAPTADPLDTTLPITLFWRRTVVDLDPAAAGEPEPDDTVTGAWDPFSPDGEPYVFEATTAGKRHQVRCEVVQGGLVVAVHQVEVTVRATDRSGRGAYHDGRGHRDEHRWRQDNVRRKRGEDLVAALTINDESLGAAIAGREASLSDEGLAGRDRASVADELATLQFAAAQRGTAVPTRLADPGPDAFTIGSLTLSEDPAFLRELVEHAYASGGASAVDALFREVEDNAREAQTDPFYADKHGLGPAPDDLPDYEQAMRIAGVMRSQWALLGQEIAAFLAEFEQRAKQGTKDRLLEAFERVNAEADRYGVKAPGTGDPDPGKLDPDARTQMLLTAAELAGKQRELDEVRHRLEQVFLRWSIAADSYYPAGYGRPAADPAYDEYNGQGVDELAMLRETLERLVRAEQEEHSNRVLVATETYPILAVYKRPVSDGYGERLEVDAGGLDRVLRATGPDAEIAAQSSEVVANIARTMVDLELGALDVWRQPRVVEMTKTEMLVVPGSVRDTAVRTRAAEDGTDWTTYAVLALTVALSLVAAIPTGGASLWVDAAFLAEGAMLGIDLYTALDALETYQIGRAAANTDYDRARAIAAEEPSLVWVVIDMAAVGLSVTSMVSTFRHVAGAWNQAAHGGAQIDEAVATVRAEVEAGNLSADVADRLEREMLERGGRPATPLADDAAGVVDEAGAGAVGVADGPVRVRTPHHDVRTRMTADRVAQLEAQLGVTIVIDDGAKLSNGVELHYQRVKTVMGTDVEPTVLRIGPAALLEDVLAHGNVIRRLTRYNGLLGKLRGLWDEFFALAKGAANPFPKGSRGWESFEELRKLDELIELRRAGWSPDVIDGDTLADEIAFLEGRKAHHAEIIQSAKETGAVKLGADGGAGFIESPDVGKVTKEAEAMGYKLPGPPDQADANPDWYYYRHKKNQPDVYELAVKPTAPPEAKSYRATVKGGAFEGLEDGALRVEATQITAAWTDADVVTHLLDSDGFGPYAAMLKRQGLSTDEEIEAAIVTARQSAKGKAINEDALRGKVKDVFRARVEATLTDEALTNEASWLRMREMLDGLHESDRGNLCEIWYKSRYAKDADPHVAARVTRSGGPNAGKAEDRAIDLFDGKQAIEIKDVAGTVDKEQFRAYLDMIANRTMVKAGGEAVPVKKLKYVFTKPEGAKANLGWLAEQFDTEKVADVLSIDVFDASGKLHTLTSKKEVENLLASGVLG